MLGKYFAVSVPCKPIHNLQQYTRDQDLAQTFLQFQLCYLGVTYSRLKMYAPRYVAYHQKHFLE